MRSSMSELNVLASLSVALGRTQETEDHPKKKTYRHPKADEKSENSIRP